jgi:exopolysaccharide production protein ExoQ
VRAMIWTAPTQTAKASPHTTYYSALLTTFVVLTLVGLRPLLPHVQNAGLVEWNDGTAERQILYLVLLGLTVLPILRSRLTTLASAIPVLFVAVLAWSAITLLWSAAPLIGLRRLALTAIVIATVFLLVSQLPPLQVLKVLKRSATALVVCSFFLCLILPTVTIHQPADSSADLVGSWRGLFPMKIPAAIVASLVGLWLWDDVLRRPRISTSILLAISFSFLLMTHGKAAIGFTTLLMPIVAIARFWMTRHAARRIWLAVCVVAALFLCLTLAFEFDFRAFEDDPRMFTGRGVVWNYAWQLISNRWLLGYGFGSIFDVGFASPLLSIARNDWSILITHAHNGYLDLAASTGIVGLMLALASIALLPVTVFLRLSKPDYVIIGPIFVSFTLFLLAHNLLETSLFNRNDNAWVLFLLLFSTARQMVNETSMRIEDLPKLST